MNIKEIARRAEVSISTVSRVINNTAKVSEEARKRVEAVLEETGYRPNSLARELQQNKTNTIGLLMSASELGMSSLSIAINAITDVLKEKGYNLMLANARFSVDEELNFFRVFQEKRVDGILYFATEITAQHERLLNNYPIPIVVIGQKADNLSYPSVIHNDYQGAMAATQYLLQMGHRQLGYIGVALTDEAVGFERHRGYEAALVENGLEPKQMSYAEGDFSMESGYQAMKGFIEQKVARPTAVFAATDYMAIGAMKCAMDLGLSVPDDISVIGFDDVHVAEFYHPSLTTIHSDNYHVGEQAAIKLLAQLEGKKVIPIYTAEFQLVQRESVKKIR